MNKNITLKISNIRYPKHIPNNAPTIIAVA